MCGHPAHAHTVHGATHFEKMSRDVKWSSWKQLDMQAQLCQLRTETTELDDEHDHCSGSTCCLSGLFHKMRIGRSGTALRTKPSGAMPAGAVMPAAADDSDWSVKAGNAFPAIMDDDGQGLLPIAELYKRGYIRFLHAPPLRQLQKGGCALIAFDARLCATSHHIPCVPSCAAYSVHAGSHFSQLAKSSGHKRNS